MIAAIIIFAALAALFAILFFVSLKKNKDQRVQDRIRSDKELKLLKEQIEKLATESQNTSENRIVELNNRISEKNSIIINLDEQIDQKKQELGDIAVRWTYISLNKENAQEELEEILKNQKDNSDKVFQLQEEIRNSEEILQSDKMNIETIKKELKDLSERKRLAILNQEEIEDKLWDYSITPKEQELISILERIKNDYPELKLDISTIEWRKVWMPKVQDLSNSKGLERKGIYRLVLKSDPGVCYVGQATNIKDRWYQHIKKMVGVDFKGNEKLYNYRPEDFYWSVIEFDPQNLNESEHYWIEYYGCKEKGLNRKA